MFTKALGCVALLVLTSGSASAGHVPSYQQGTKLVGYDAVGPSAQGNAVALSGDGNTALSGGYADNSNAGAVWAFTRSNGVWIQQGLKLVGTGAAGPNVGQGLSVALSGDGNTAIEGGYGDNSGAGAAWCFTRSSGEWSQMGAKLVGSGGVGAGYQGFSVAISADGNTAIVGGILDNSSVGAAWVYKRSVGTWVQQGPKLVGTGAVGASGQGHSVALSADGNTAIVGGYNDNSNAGAAWVYTRTGGVWTQQGAKLVGSGALGNANQGTYVALSADGNTAIVGGYQDNSGAGAAWVYTRSGGVWTQQGPKLVASDWVGTAHQANYVALSADGNTAILGGYGDNANIGAAWIYTRNAAGVWSQQGAKLVGSGAVGAANQGSVSMSADGATAIVGGYNDNGGLGAAWVFVDPTPAIAKVADVPNDQGGRVTVRWNASLLDNGITDPINAYWIWRQVPAGTASTGPVGGAALMRPGDPVPRRGEIRASIQAGQTYYWEYIGIMGADGLPGYSFTAPTTGDSVAGSNPYTLFMVETRATSGAHWPSDPDSGYSVDNLPPGAPAPIFAVYQAGATHFHWGVNPEPDFSLYRIYKGTSAGFVPGSGNLIASKPDTGYADAGAAGSYYKLSAVDIHGNESPFALVTPGATAGVNGGAVQFALDPLPNPSRGGQMLVSFSLPSGEPAQLVLVDVNGREASARDVGALGPGRHAIDLGDQRRLAPGIYFVRLTQRSHVALARVAVLD